MSTVFVRHEVADFDAWRSGFEDHGSTRREFGLTDAGLYRATGDPNDVTIVLTTDDVPRAMEFFESDDLRETLSRAGVVSAPDVWIADEA